MLPIMLVLCSNMNSIVVNILLLEYSIKVFMILLIGLFDSICAFQCILNFLLERIESLTLYNLLLYALIVLLENIDLILVHYASIMLA